MGSGADQILPMKDAQTRARIADSESEAVQSQRFIDVEAGISDPSVARKLRNQNIIGILVLVGIAVFIYLLFFVLA
jgi:hypothetical protein